jgi:hypothetical protein
MKRGLMTKDLGSYPGHRMALSPAGPRPAAVWAASRNQSLFSTWLDASASSVSPKRIEQGASGAFVQPVIQAISRKVVAVAWTDDSGRRPRVRLATYRLDGKGRSSLLQSYRSAPGQSDVDLALTSGGDLVLASTSTAGQGGAVVVQRFRPRTLRPSSRLVIEGGSPRDPHLAGLSARAADMAVLYRDDGGISLATLNVARGRLIKSLRLSGQRGAKGPALASDGSRRLAAAWAVRNPGTGEDVQLQIINAATGGRTAIHQPHVGAQGDQRDPMIAISPRGWIRSAWRDNNGGSLRISSGLSRLGGDGRWQRGSQFSTAAGVRSDDPDVITLDKGSALLGWTETRGRNERVRLAVLPDRSFGAAGTPADPGRPGQGNRNRIEATLQQDVLTGTAARDVFVFPTRSHSLLNRYDKILRYQSNDVIDDHHARKNVTVDPITRSAGTIQSLNPAQLKKVCQRRFGYGVFGAVAFEVKGEPGTWLAINDRRDGFQSNSDPILHLADYRVSRTTPITII